MSRFEIHHADVMDWAKSYTGSPFHAILTDPPYHLTSGNAVYDLAKTGAGNPRESRESRGGGFMGQQWDGGDVAFQPETWAAFLPHLLPGAFGFAFASSRGVHRMACAIEDAGFRLHPTIWCWCTGQSFPKATRVPDSRFDGHRYGGQALKGSVEPIVCFQKPYAGRPVDCITATGAGALNIDASRIMPTSQDPADAALACRAVAWLGIQAKRDVPSAQLESVLCSLRRISSVLRSGSKVGTDPLRGVAAQDGTPPDRALCDFVHGRLFPNGVWCAADWTALQDFRGDCPACHRSYGELLRCVQEAAQDGAPSLSDALERTCKALSEPSRIHSYGCSDHLSNGGDFRLAVTFAELLLGLFLHYILPHSTPPQQGRWPANFVLGDSETARLLDAQSGQTAKGHWPSGGKLKSKNVYGEWRGANGEERFAEDNGGASRFFFESDWNAEVEEALAAAEPVKYASKVSSSEREAGCDHLSRQNWMDGHTAPIPQRDERDSPGSGNHHPTLKPLALCKHLAALLSPPIEYAPRRILVPFAGTMSEGMGAALAGWEHITGIEQDAEYIRIAQARIRHHLGMLGDVQVLEGVE